MSNTICIVLRKGAIYTLINKGEEGDHKKPTQHTFPLTPRGEVHRFCFHSLRNKWIPQRIHLLEVGSFISLPGPKPMKHLTKPLQYNQKGTLTGWWQGRETASADTILPTELCSGTQQPILHSTLVLAFEGSVQVLSCKRLFYHPQETSRLSLKQLPHQQGQEKGGTTLRHHIYCYKFSSYFPYLRVQGREDAY